MSTIFIHDLRSCSEFQQTLDAKPSRALQISAALLFLLIVLAVMWGSIVEANHVVRATGRIRPTESITKVFVPADCSLGGGVISKQVQVGDLVEQGDVIVQLDTRRFEIESEKLERALAAAQEELRSLNVVQSYLQKQHKFASERGVAELERAELALKSARERNESEARSFQTEVQYAESTLLRSQELARGNVISLQELHNAEERLKLCKEKLVQCNLPIETSTLLIAKQALEAIDCDFEVKNAELKARIAAKKGETAATRQDLLNLSYQREATSLRAPVSGIIVQGAVQTGDVLEPGKPILEIAPKSDFTFEVLVRHADAGNLKIGLPAQVKLDAFDFQNHGVLCGTVVYIAPDSTGIDGAGAEKPTSTVAGASTGFVVRIALRPTSSTQEEIYSAVKLGLGGKAEIVTRQETLIRLLLHGISSSITFGTLL